MDREITKEFQKLLKKQGFKFMMNTTVVGGTVSANGATVDIEPAKGGDKKTLNADIVLVSTGRRPFTEGLQLEKAGLAANKYG